MTEIPDPPAQHTCAGCHSVLSWLWSPKTRAWICVIALDDATFRLHGCRHAQNPATWKEVRRVDPATTAAGVARCREALAQDQGRGEEER